MVFYKKTVAAFAVCMLFATVMIAQVKHKPGSHPPAGLKASIAKGELVYTRICASCHRADGAA